MTYLYLYLHALPVRHYSEPRTHQILANLAGVTANESAGRQLYSTPRMSLLVLLVVGKKVDMAKSIAAQAFLRNIYTIYDVSPAGCT